MKDCSAKKIAGRDLNLDLSWAKNLRFKKINKIKQNITKQNVYYGKFLTYIKPPETSTVNFHIPITKL